jgi:hypothetical protein
MVGLMMRMGQATARHEGSVPGFACLVDVGDPVRVGVAFLDGAVRAPSDIWTAVTGTTVVTLAALLCHAVWSYRRRSRRWTG